MRFSIRERFAQSITYLILLFIIILVRYFDAQARPLLFLDESAYLARGVAIIEEGKIPTISNSPGVSLIHSFSYLFLRDHFLGMELAGRVTAFLGGIVLYTLLYLAIRESLGHVWGILAVGLGLLYFPLYHLNGNSSDLLYAVMESVLLVFLVRLERNHLSSFPVFGLSFATAVTTLMRNDGFLIFIGLTPLIWVYSLSDKSLFKRGRDFAIHWLIPYAGVIAVMALLAWKTTGIFEILPGARTYTAFEQGTGLVRRFELEREGKNPWIEGSRIARELYGSSEENKGSVLLALLRHPYAWLQRIWMNVRDFFLRWFEAHNGRLGTITLLLSWFGWVALFTERRFFLATSVGAFLFSTLPYFFLTFWRHGYITMHSPLILFLNIHAISSLLESPKNQSWRVKIFSGSVAATIGVAFVWLAARYSDFTYGDKGLIENGITLPEIVGAVIVWGLFMKPILALEKLPMEGFRIASVALILGIWLASSEDIFSLAFSEKTMAKQTAQVRGEETLRNYIRFAFDNLRGARVCVKDPSLPWYARQKPVVVYEFFDPFVQHNLMKVVRLMEKHGCEYFLLQGGENLSVKGLLEPVFVEDGIVLVKLVGSRLEGSEIVIEDFDEMLRDKWSPFGLNNMQGDFMVQNGIVTLAYKNNLFQEDIYAYVYNLPHPLAGVVALKMRVKIYPGTLFTVDVVKDGELVAPRFLNYYSGTGDWEEVIIPVNGMLNSITIGIAEPGSHSTTPSYRIDIDWIKATVEK